jgi:hypothetical protein
VKHKTFKIPSFAPRNYVILRGGLGNQLHQIAAGVRKSELNLGKTRIFAYVVDHANDHTRRGYFRELNLTKLFPGADLREVNDIEQICLRILLKLNFRLCSQFLVDEENFETKSRYLKVSFLRSWFQSAEFLPTALDPTALVAIHEHTQSNVTIHVRLTDFSLIDKSPLGLDYYTKAIGLIPESLKNKGIICFSDDIAGASNLLPHPIKVYFPEAHTMMTPSELLVSLSSTKFLISSRSSLCWWAALAVSSNGGQVVSPWPVLPLGYSWLNP